MKTPRHLFVHVFLTVSLLWALVAGAAPAQAQNRAGVVVDYGGGNVQHKCVEFSTPTITGLELLEQAGFDVKLESRSKGDAVCSISETGCDYPNTDCFCSCEGSGTCTYWGYWILDDGDWDYSSITVNNQIVGNNGVNGWTWGGGGEPPVLVIDQICGS